MRRGKLLLGVAIVSVLASLLSVSPAQAAPSEISGTVSYSDGGSGGALEGALVTLSKDGATVASTGTDEFGSYSFPVPADGSYSVSVATPSGYKGVAPKSVVVAGGTPDPEELDFGFTPVSVAGYWMAAADGGVFAYGDAKSYGSMGGKQLAAPVVGLIGSPTNEGYYLVASDGGVFAFGDASFYGSMGGRALNSPIVGIYPAVAGEGYYLVAADGGVFAFGPDASFQGSMGGQRLNSPVVGMTVDLSDFVGYHLVAADGGVFSFGADFRGSAGGQRLNSPVVGIAPSLELNEETFEFDGGYWLAAADGGVFAYEADFYGSAGNVKLNRPVVGIDSASDGSGYVLAAADGGVFTYPSTVESYGSAANLKLAAPVVGIWTV